MAGVAGPQGESGAKGDVGPQGAPGMDAEMDTEALQELIASMISSNGGESDLGDLLAIGYVEGNMWYPIYSAEEMADTNRVFISRAQAGNLSLEIFYPEPNP